MKNSQRETIPHCHNQSKKILILSDFHCGHRYGLSHPDQCVNQYQKKAWEFFDRGIKQNGPYDIVFCNGDLITGKERKSGSRELITSDLEEQADMAIKILRHVQHLNGKKPLRFFFVRGTPYHVGSDEADWENIIAREFRYKEKKNIDEKLLVKVSGIIFDLKHKISSGSLPHTRSSAPARDIIFAILKESYENRAKANVFIRSHVHYYNMVETMGRIAITTPALQINSSFGERQCSGIVDFGFLVMNVCDGKVMNIIKCISDEPIKKELVIEA